MMKKLAGQILWLIIAIYAFAVLLPPLFPKLESPLNAVINTAALCAFALISSDYVMFTPPSRKLFLVAPRTKLCMPKLLCCDLQVVNGFNKPDDLLGGLRQI